MLIVNPHILVCNDCHHEFRRMLLCLLIGPMFRASAVFIGAFCFLILQCQTFLVSFACVCHSDEAQSHARGVLHFLVTELVDSRTSEPTFSEHSISQKDVFWVSE